MKNKKKIHKSSVKDEFKKKVANPFLRRGNFGLNVWNHNALERFKIIFPNIAEVHRTASQILGMI